MGWCTDLVVHLVAAGGIFWPHRSGNWKSSGLGVRMRIVSTTSSHGITPLPSSSPPVARKTLRARVVIPQMSVGESQVHSYVGSQFRTEQNDVETKSKHELDLPVGEIAHEHSKPLSGRQAACLDV